MASTLDNMELNLFCEFNDDIFEVVAENFMNDVFDFTISLQ